MDYENLDKTDGLCNNLELYDLSTVHLFWLRELKLHSLHSILFLDV